MSNDSLEFVLDDLESSDQADLVSTEADKQWNVNSTSHFVLNAPALSSRRRHGRQSRSHMSRASDYW